MDEKLVSRLKIPNERLDEINQVLLDPQTEVVKKVLEVIQPYGTPEEINEKAKNARKLPHLLEKVKQARPEYLADLEWLQEQARCRCLHQCTELPP